MVGLGYLGLLVLVGSGYVLGLGGGRLFWSYYWLEIW